MTEVPLSTTDEHFNRDPSQLVGPVQVAPIFGVQPSTIQRWGRKGTIPTLRFPNGRRMFSLDWCRWYVGQKGLQKRVNGGG